MKYLKRISSTAVSAVLTLSSLMTFGFTGVAHATANNHTQSRISNASVTSKNVNSNKAKLFYRL